MRFLYSLIFFSFFIAYSNAQDLEPHRKKGKYGYVLKSNKKKKQVIIPHQFESATSFHRGVACAEKNGKWGYINKKGETLLPFEYDFTETFILPTANVKLNGKHGIVSLDMQYIIEPRLDSIHQIFNYFLFQENGKYGILDSLGKILLNAEHEEIGAGYKDYNIVRNGSETFKFEDGELTISSPEELVYLSPDELPRFPGCEDKFFDKKELGKCSEDKMLRAIYSNINYPAIARENGIQGTVIAGFRINKYGIADNFEIFREVGGGCDEEVLRVLKSIPKWVPGKEEGQVVDSYIQLPVRFRIE